MIANLDEFFWKCFFYLRTNSIPGDYLEFGCGSNVRSFRLAAKYRATEYHAPRLFAFDSFAGLPEPAAIDQHPGWKKGAMAVSVEEFRATLQRQGLSDTDYQMVPGFFDRTLDGHRPADYGVARAAFAFVDCDLYESTRSVLGFVADAMEHGAILAFDDWNCFRADPEKGEQLAFREFRAAHPELSFTEFLPFGWHGRSFIVHRRPV